MHKGKGWRNCMSDFHNLADSGKACVGCGRGVKDGVALMRIRTYARSYSCFDCWRKHQSCANVSPTSGRKCNHERHAPGLCAHCDCPVWIHGLEQEFDRQLANCVGIPKGATICNGYGVNLGKCGRMIFADSENQVSRLCVECEDRWNREAAEQDREI